MPICLDCAILRHVTVYMQRMLEESTINAPKEPDPDGLPEGLRPFERQVIRGMRRAAARTAEKERALIVAWVRKQKAASWARSEGFGRCRHVGLTPPKVADLQGFL
jgi:hypothetical protein